MLLLIFYTVEDGSRDSCKNAIKFLYLGGGSEAVYGWSETWHHCTPQSSGGWLHHCRVCGFRMPILLCSYFPDAFAKLKEKLKDVNLHDFIQDSIINKIPDLVPKFTWEGAIKVVEERMKQIDFDKITKQLEDMHVGEVS